MVSLCGVALVAWATPAVGQTAPRHIVSVNPFLPLAESFQAEFEQRLRDNLSVAVSGSHVKLDDDDEKRYTNADVKLRLYPMERGLEGFAIAAGVGVGRQSTPQYVICPAIFPIGECARQGFVSTGATFSVEMHYQWLLGSKRNTAVTVGGGARRYFIDKEPEGFNRFDEFRPTLRLTIGYAFR